MTALDPRWVGAIRRHAEIAPPTPEAWTSITDRAEGAPGDLGARRPSRAGARARWPLAAAAVALISLGLAALLVVRGDGDGAEDVRTGPSPAEVLPSSETPVEVAGTATVLESPEHGPEMCFGGVQESEPPQCRGLPLVGWDWSAVQGEESAIGTTWGSYRVTGDYDGERLVVTEPARPPDRTPDPDRPPDPDFATPCPEPAGGWVVRDPARLTPDHRAALQTALEAQPDFGLMWVDRSIPVGGSGNERGVLNATFTGDLDRHRAQIEALWGGPVCVTATEVSQDDLQRAADEVLPPDGSEPPLVVDGFRLRVRGVSSGNAWQELQITVEFEPPGAQAALTDRLGVPVRLIPTLRPTG